QKLPLSYPLLVPCLGIMVVSEVISATFAGWCSGEDRLTEVGAAVVKNELRIADVLELLARRCRAAGGQRAFARQHGFTVSYIVHVLHGRRPPSERLCEALGVEDDGRRWISRERYPATVNTRPDHPAARCRLGDAEAGNAHAPHVTSRT